MHTGANKAKLEFYLRCVVDCLIVPPTTVSTDSSCLVAASPDVWFPGRRSEFIDEPEDSETVYPPYQRPV